MEKVRLAQNIMLMLEAVRAKGLTNEEILRDVEHKEAAYFEPFGRGIPDWATFIEFARGNSEKFKQALEKGYQVGFLTFGGLKTLLNIKFNLTGEKDYELGSDHVQQVPLTSEQLDALKSILSNNWIIAVQEQNQETEKSLVKIHLTQL